MKGKLPKMFIKNVTAIIGVLVLLGVSSIGKNMPIGCEEVYAAVGDTFEFEGIKYKVDDENSCGVIADTTKYTGEIIIPKKVVYDSKEYDVTFIYNGAFENCSDLTSVTIPNSVTAIERGAFYGCSGLTNIDIPSSVRSIGEFAFYDCSGLTGGVTIPNGVLFINNYTFKGCSGLTSITIPSSVTRIDSEAFGKCYSLKEINVDENSKFYKSIDNVLFKNESSIVLYPCGKEETTYTIPNDVTGIGYYAFADCENLKSITIPNSVTSIGMDAFKNCSGLTSIEIPNSIISIGSGAFVGCRSLINITIPDSVTSIGSSVFSGCHNLTSIEIPDSVTSIEDSIFFNCWNLTSITMPNSVTNTNIGNKAFFGCYNLTNIEIPDNVTNIGESAFSGCSGLTSIKIPNSVNSIGNYAFQSCRNLTSIEIPSNVMSIGNSAFRACRGLTSVTIPGSVENIGTDVFSGCDYIKDVYLYADGTENSEVDLNDLSIGSGVKIHVRSDDVNKYIDKYPEMAEQFLSDLKESAKDAINQRLSEEYYYAQGNVGGGDNDKTYVIYVFDGDIENTDYIKITDIGGTEDFKAKGSDEVLKIEKVYKKIQFPDGSVLNAEELAGEGKYIVAVKLDAAVVPSTEKFKFVPVGE